MQTIIVLAGSYTEGRRFASNTGLGMRAIVPADASRCQGLRPQVILELPSYAHRRDRHAIDSVLLRSVRHIGNPAIEMLVDPEDFRPERVVVDSGPVQTTVEEQVALAEVDRLARLAAFDTTATETSPVQEEANAPAPEAETPPKPGGPAATAYKPRSRARKKS